jgi:hypothetical protein
VSANAVSAARPTVTLLPAILRPPPLLPPLPQPRGTASQLLPAWPRPLSSPPHSCLRSHPH